ncbi:putative diphthamide synthesis protein-domain-containing protein [Obelidium mucronatum]|nr:putative diphthamide synthesis protein-domain-containing protein [Obelidium mucronatum]
MRKLRNTAIENLESLSVSSPSISSVKPLVGIIIGTLGRQGSPAVLRNLHAMVPKNTTSVFILLSEIFPAKLQTIGSKSENPVKAYIQTSCPRLSIDWGHSFGVPLLSPYEAAVAFGKTEAKWRSKKEESVDEGGGGEIYPMDFYSRASKGNWTPNHVEGALEKEQAKEAAKIAAIN